MKKRLWILAALLLVAALVITPVLYAASGSSAAKPGNKPPPGIEAAQALSTITGVAISPLLGVGAVGAWQYCKAPAAQRANLAWYAQPWFWIPALLIVGLCLAKDVGGTAIPGVLKKPLDVAEALENKLSALVAAGAFVPLVASIFPAATPQAGLLSGTDFAAIDFSPLLNLMLIPIAISAFAVVWLAAHAINVLILISPFATVDAALKSFRTVLLGSVVATSWADPMMGAAWCLVLILVAYLIAGWSLRMMMFGSVFIWDFVSFGHRRFEPRKEGVWAFTARPIGKAPVRTFGRLMRNAAGQLLFRFRPWLVLPAQEIMLPDNIYAMGRGFFYPELLQLKGEHDRTVLLFPPRCREHEDELGKLFDLAETQDVGLLKGFKAIWRWVKSLFGFGMKAANNPAPACSRSLAS